MTGAAGARAASAAYAAVRRAVLAEFERFRPEELRRAPRRCRVEVSKGLWVEAGLSCRAHHSVLLYRDSRTPQVVSRQTRPAAKTSGGLLPDNPSAKNEASSTVRRSTMPSLPFEIRSPSQSVFGMKEHKL